MWVRPLGQEDPLEEGMTTCPSILAWRITWTEKPGGLQYIESQRVEHDWSDLACVHAPGSFIHGDSPGKNTAVGCHALLQGIFPTQGSNRSLLQCRWILYHLSQQGSPRILKRVACPFSRGTSQPRSQARVSCFAGRFFTSWATGDKQYF